MNNFLHGHFALLTAQVGCLGVLFLVTRHPVEQVIDLAKGPRSEPSMRAHSWRNSFINLKQSYGASLHSTPSLSPAIWGENSIWVGEGA